MDVVTLMFFLRELVLKSNFSNHTKLKSKTKTKTT